MKNTPHYGVYWAGRHLGDNLLAAWVVNILNFNGLPAYLTAVDPYRAALFNCKLDPELDFLKLNKWRHLSNRTESIIRDKQKIFRVWRTVGPPPKESRSNPYGFNILTDMIQFFINVSGIDRSLDDFDIENSPHPNLFEEENDIPAFDVSMVTATSKSTPYRDWPYFLELKSLLSENDISYIDLTEKDIRSNTFLNYVKNSKIYLGLETGPSHYAAPVTKKNKSFIIQSGYCSPKYWAYYYNYTHIENPVECSPCWLKRGCSIDHACMKHIKPTQVLQLLQKSLALS